MFIFLQAAGFPDSDNLQEKIFIARVGENNFIAKQGRYLDVDMIFLIWGAVYHTADSGMTILVLHFAMLDDTQWDHIILENCIHYTKVGMLGPVHVGHKVPDFRNKMGGKVPLTFLGFL